jgi:DNA-binding MarR family transcriptional regulator
MSITDAGIALLDSERRSRDAWLSQRLAQLTPDDRAALRNVVPVLDKLAAL